MRRGTAATVRGFTMIELMIALVVIAILAAIAYPSYLDAVRKGWRAEARAALLQEMQQQERFYTQRARYRDTVFASDSGLGAGAGRYTLTLDPCEGQPDARRCIRLQASLRSGFSDPQVRSLWLDSRGEKGCSGTASPRACWP
ncbi:MULTISPECIES: type IV pilin protein [unclassified Variovorax]|uniref:type IV pilin protein n=1 Tax=unclassified Variovorax TaxID=663243 RepID=UPI002574CFCC|nr:MULTISPECIES: type IV pilin protein [unclassified Variovorax]MDM0086800.1 type IV pilin protein [Variovorax sp. J22G40]MDM0144944.1 type IV pilin protein [Variovorax sp. J2P1-31]